MIYFDHHASSPVIEPARDAMLRAMPAAFANPSSVHRAGREAQRIVEDARRAVAQACGSHPADIVFTSGGTEACNLGVLGVTSHRARVVTTDIEHPAIGKALDELGTRGSQVHKLSFVHGRPPTADEFAAALTPETTLVALQWVNHETGTVVPVEAYAAVCATRGVPLVVDATQAFGKIPIDVSSLGATAVALGSQKIGGPAGAGALYVRRGTEVASLIVGGGQERGRRAGTPDVVALAGFGAAAANISDRLTSMKRVEDLRDDFEGWLLARGAVLNASEGPRVATVTNVSFQGVRAEVFVAALDVEGLCVSAGAACSSGVAKASPVLLAMHADEPWRAESAVRFSFGPSTTREETEAAKGIVSRVLERIRGS